MGLDGITKWIKHLYESGGHRSQPNVNIDFFLRIAIFLLNEVERYSHAYVRKKIYIYIYIEENVFMERSNC